jgi:hypothetical protein
MIKSIALLGVLFLMPMSQAVDELDQPESAAPYIEKIFAAYGGKQKLAAAASFRIEGTVFPTMGKPKAPTIRTFSRPNRLKIVIDYPGAPELRILDGEKGRRSDRKGNAVQVNGIQHGSMVLQAARINIPWILEEVKDNARLIPPVMHNEKELKGIEVLLGEGLLLNVYFDPKNYFVVQSRAVLNIGKINTFFDTFYSDFREIRGIIFPFREENHASGFHTATTVIKRVVLNPVVPENEFSP